MTLFTLKMVVDGEPCEVGYESPEALLGDTGLQAIFEDNLVQGCKIYVEEKQIAGLAFMRWERLLAVVKARF